MLLTVIWTLIGLVAGGMLGGALADLGAGHRGDIGALFVGLLLGALFGAVGGGLLGRTAHRNGDSRQKSASWNCWPPEP